MWSYTFSNYAPYRSVLNIVTPRPNWPRTHSDIDAPISTTPPLNETDYNAVNFTLWKNIGKGEICIVFKVYKNRNFNTEFIEFLCWTGLVIQPRSHVLFKI